MGDTYLHLHSIFTDPQVIFDSSNMFLISFPIRIIDPTSKC